MKTEPKDSPIETKLKKEASSFTISKSAEDILQAYKIRKANKTEPVIKIPFYKRAWFKAASAFGIAAIIAGSSLGIYFKTRNSDNTPLFSTPILANSSDKLIFSANNAAGFLIKDNLLTLNPKNRVFGQNDNSSEEDDDSDESEDSENDEDNDDEEDSESEDKTNVTSAELDDIASTYHTIFKLLE